MTGPAYPRSLEREPVSGAAMLDVWETVASQYGTSPTLTALISSFANAIDPRPNLQAFYSLIWNVDTAQGYGLDVWGRIVGVSRVLNVSSEDYFGFAEASPGSKSFAEAGASGGVFYTGATLTTSYALSDRAYRKLIFAKAAANISDGSIRSINAILMLLFGDKGRAYVTEGYPGPGFFGFAEAKDARGFNPERVVFEPSDFAAEDFDASSPTNPDAGPLYTGQDLNYLTMTYTFEFQPDPLDLAIVGQSGVLPKPTGIAASIIIKA